MSLNPLLFAEADEAGPFGGAPGQPQNVVPVFNNQQTQFSDSVNSLNTGQVAANNLPPNAPLGGVGIANTNPQQGDTASNDLGANLQNPLPINPVQPGEGNQLSNGGPVGLGGPNQGSVGAGSQASLISNSNTLQAQNQGGDVQQSVVPVASSAENTGQVNPFVDQGTQQESVQDTNVQNPVGNAQPISADNTAQGGLTGDQGVPQGSSENVMDSKYNEQRQIHFVCLC